MSRGYLKRRALEGGACPPLPFLVLVGLSAATCDDGRERQALSAVEILLDSMCTLRVQLTYDGERLSKARLFQTGGQLLAETRVIYFEDRVSGFISRYDEMGEGDVRRSSARVNYFDGELDSISCRLEQVGRNDYRSVETLRQGGQLREISIRDESESPIGSVSYSYSNDRLSSVSRVEPHRSSRQRKVCNIGYEGERVVVAACGLAEAPASPFRLEYNDDGKVREVRASPSEAWRVEYGDDRVARIVSGPREVRFEYEDFSVKGFAFLPYVALPDGVWELVDLSGRSYSEPDVLSEIVTRVLLRNDGCFGMIFGDEVRCAEEI